MNFYFLDESMSFTVARDANVGAPRWAEIVGLPVKRKAMIVVMGEKILLPPVTLGPDHVLLVTLGKALPQISPDGLTAEFGLRLADGSYQKLFSQLVTNEMAEPWREITIELGSVAERTVGLEVECGAGPAGQSDADWLAVFELVIGRRDEISRIRTQSFKNWRIKNEVSHFAETYSHEVYHQEQAQPHPLAECRASSQPVARVNARTPTVPPPPAAQSNIPPRLLPDEAPPVESNAWNYGNALLQHKLRIAPPDFPGRLQAMAQQKFLRVLSICSGEARVEAELAWAAAVPLEMTLVDVAPGLLEQAKGKFPPFCSLHTKIMDLNLLSPDGSKYDLIICVSGMHHLIDLERVTSAINEMLGPKGQYWNIGEQVGRNGNRLWSDAYDRADALFSVLPSKYRLNRTTGKVDEHLPNIDGSVSTCEGIRSQEIERVYSRFLEPIEVYRRNCFLWRLLDLSYMDNYDCNNPADRAVVEAAVEAEYAHWREGGLPTELSGIYRSRFAYS